MIADLSICIPTFDRARLLSTCLAHLAGFADRSFELVVGDNASADDTPAVLDAFRDRLPGLVVVRHAENIGYLRNMDALLRRASRRYAYILSDDDLVFEDALQLATSVLDASPQVVAVVGGYLSVRTLDPALRIDYASAIARVIPRGGQAAVLADTAVADGHPVLRRDAFARHCAYRERVNLIPLYCELLDHGDVVAVDRPFFQHLTNADSLTSRMAEPWFIDMVNADLEMALSNARDGAAAAGLEPARQKLLPVIYFQAARMSALTGDANAAWFFLRRLGAVAGLPDDLALHCERHFAHDLLCTRVARIAADAAFPVLWVADADPVTACVAAHVARGPGAPRVVAGDAPPQGALALCHRFDATTEAVRAAPHRIALAELFAQYRLVRHPARLVVGADGRVDVNPDAAEHAALMAAPSAAFARLLAPYSEVAPASQEAAA
ncbi:MAG: glycosyltransferase [Burkholderiales bacterium]|nr:glycosyltransferase [Burkholderiales bacterium]